MIRPEIFAKIEQHPFLYERFNNSMADLIVFILIGVGLHTILESSRKAAKYNKPV